MQATYFTEYIKKYKVGRIIKKLEEPITFNDIGIQICLYKENSMIDFEPLYKQIKFAEIEIEFHSIKSFSLTIDDEQILNPDISYYDDVSFFVMDNHKIEIHCHEINTHKKATLVIEFSNFIIDYDASTDISIDAIDYIDKLGKTHNLFATLAKQMDGEMLMQIANADYGNPSDECVSILKNAQETATIPKKIPFEVGEVLTLTAYSRTKSEKERILKSFAIVFLILGDYNYSIADDPYEYWYITLLAESKNFTTEYKEELLSFYVCQLSRLQFSWYIPLNMSLIICQMAILKYPSNDIYFLINEFKKLDSELQYEFAFVPDGTMAVFNKTLKTIDDETLRKEISQLTNSMILEYSKKD